MISSKLKMLERQLSKVGGRDTGDGGSSTKALLAFQSVVEEEANALIEAAEAKCREAEGKVNDLHRQIAELNKQLVQMQKDSSGKMEEMHKSYENEKAAMCEKHRSEMDQARITADALRNQVSSMLQDNAKVQAEKEACDRMCKHLEGMVAKLQEVKPVTPVLTNAPAVAHQARPVTAKVTQRDENGRIVAISITPSS